MPQDRAVFNQGIQGFALQVGLLTHIFAFYCYHHRISTSALITGT